MADAQQPAAEAPAATPPPPAAPEVKPVPKGRRFTSSREAIEQGIKAMEGLVSTDAPVDDDDAPPPAAETPPAEAPEPQSPAPEPAAAKTEDRPSWNDIMERDHATREKARELAEKERAIADKEAKLKSVADAAKLLEENPAEFVQKFGGQDFAARYVNQVKNGGVPDPLPRVQSVEQKVDSLLEELRRRDEREAEDRHIGEHMDYLTSKDDAGVLRGWYDAEEYRGLARNIRRNRLQAGEKELTPAEAVGTLTAELKQRLERLSKTPAGQQILRSLLGGEQPKPNTQPTRKPATQPTGAKTLSSDLAASGNPPPAPRLRKRTERDAIIADVLKQLPSGE